MADAVLIPPPIYGLLAEFESPQALVEASEQVRRAGYRRIDAYSPFPIEELAEALDFRDRRLPLFVLLGIPGVYWANFFGKIYA